MSGIPVWLLDVDGVINAATKKPDPNVWPKDQWVQGNAQCDGREWPITWSRPVIEFIREVHGTGRAEVRWHTTWQHEASAISDLTGLPQFGVAEAPEFEGGSGYTAQAFREAKRSTWWKLPAAERVVREEKRPLIWTDDDITWSLHRYNADAGLRAYAPALLVSPNERTGLTRRHLRQISDFLDIHAPIEVTA